LRKRTAAGEAIEWTNGIMSISKVFKTMEYIRKIEYGNYLKRN
jgi:hypothetical protein